MRRPSAASAARSSRVMSDGVSVVVYPYGHITSRPVVWKLMDARICWRPWTTRLRTNAASADPSGLEKADVPRKVLLDGVLPDPPQQPHGYAWLRFRSVPIAVEPAWAGGSCATR